MRSDFLWRHVVHSVHPVTLCFLGFPLTRSASEMACMRGHDGPVLELTMGLGTAVTGGRDGVAIAWDLETATAITELRGHKGHVTAVEWFADDDANVFLSGAQDGHVRVWDLRTKREVANVAAHTSDRGSGAVGCITSTAATDTSALGSNVVVTAGADAQVAVLEPRAGFSLAHKFTEHKCVAVVGRADDRQACHSTPSPSPLLHLLSARDFIYSLYCAGTMCFSGAGDGMLLVHDLVERKVLWGIGANECVQWRCRWGFFCVSCVAVHVCRSLIWHQGCGAMHRRVWGPLGCCRRRRQRPRVCVFVSVARTK